MTREPIGHDWLSPLRQRFPEEFPEDGMAQRAIEKNVAAERSKQQRYGEANV